MATECKTRREAEAASRPNPHYYLPDNYGHIFIPAGPEVLSRSQLNDIFLFESKIDWTTWGPSR